MVIIMEVIMIDGRASAQPSAGRREGVGGDPLCRGLAVREANVSPGAGFRAAQSAPCVAPLNN